MEELKAAREKKERLDVLFCSKLKSIIEKMGSDR